MPDIYLIANDDPGWGEDQFIKNHIEHGKSQLRYFIQKLYPGQAFGRLILWTKQDKNTYPIDATDIDKIVETAISLSRTKDVYFGVGLQKENPPKGQRGTTETVSHLPGLWMDIDVRGPHHKMTALPGSIEEAVEFLRSLKPAPSLIIDTGGGLHVYWVFDQLYHIDSADKFYRIRDVSKSFQQKIIAEGEKYGWTLDNTADLARLLRLPGTWNWKETPPNPVYILEPNYADLPF